MGKAPSGDLQFCNAEGYLLIVVKMCDFGFNMYKLHVIFKRTLEMPPFYLIT